MKDVLSPEVVAASYSSLVKTWERTAIYMRMENFLGPGSLFIASNASEGCRARWYGQQLDGFIFALLEISLLSLLLQNMRT